MATEAPQLSASELDRCITLLKQERDRLLTVIEEHRRRFGTSPWQANPDVSIVAKRFVRAGRQIPGFLHELEERACFVQRLTQDESEYRQLRISVRTFKASVHHASGTSVRQFPDTFEECTNCKDLQAVIDDVKWLPDELGVSNTAIERLRSVAEDIQSNAELIAADGCRFLWLTDRCPDSSQGIVPEFLHEGQWLKEIEAAATSMTDFVEKTTSAENTAPILSEPQPPAEPRADLEISITSEIVTFHWFGTAFPLEKTAGVERLIAILISRRVSAVKLAKIGSQQIGQDRESVGIDEDHLSERESLDDGRFEGVLGEDASGETRDAIRELIERMDAELKNDDHDEADRLTETINAVLDKGKSNLQSASATVRHSLNRTYARLETTADGKEIARHFRQSINRPRGEADFVYRPDESARNFPWILK